MKIYTLLLLVFLAIIAAFAALNWSAFMTPTLLSLGVADVQAPLGVIMLGLLTIFTSLFLAFVVFLQTSVLIESRRHARELQANRTLADQSEASRITELRGFLEMELARQATLAEESRMSVLARMDQLDHDLRAAFEQSENTLSAYIGELDDRLERAASGQSIHPTT